MASAYNMGHGPHHAKYRLKSLYKLQTSMCLGYLSNAQSRALMLFVADPLHLSLELGRDGEVEYPRNREHMYLIPTLLFSQINRIS